MAARAPRCRRAAAAAILRPVPRRRPRSSRRLPSEASARAARVGRTRAIRRAAIREWNHRTRPTADFARLRSLRALRRVHRRPHVRRPVAELHANGGPSPRRSAAVTPLAMPRERVAQHTRSVPHGARGGGAGPRRAHLRTRAGPAELTLARAAAFRSRRREPEHRRHGRGCSPSPSRSGAPSRRRSQRRELAATVARGEVLVTRRSSTRRSASSWVASPWSEPTLGHSGRSAAFTAAIGSARSSASRVRCLNVAAPTEAVSASLMQNSPSASTASRSVARSRRAR